jgi:hypothetical protein
MRSIASFSRGGPWLVLAAVGALTLSGCNFGGPYPVRGQLLYEDDGTPVKELAGFDVTFTSEKLGKSARGTIQPDGTFRLGGLVENDGAYPGEYVVIVSQPKHEPERPNLGDPVVDLAYEDPATSDLKAEVKAESNNFTFKLRRLKRSK